VSAYILADDAIHRLVVALKVDRFFEHYHHNLLGDLLLQMNEAAVNARYRENNRRNEPYVWQEPTAFPAMQALKTIRCFLYQCSEGDVPEAWPLFAEVVKVREFYAELLGWNSETDRWSSAQRAAEYQAAVWS
jgi:hypothetical protein